MDEKQAEAQKFLSLLQNWRKDKEVLHSGKLLHFVPESGIYVYFRTNDEEVVMVVLNNNNGKRKMPLPERFDECLNGKRKAYEVITQTEIENLKEISLPPKSAMILEIK